MKHCEGIIRLNPLFINNLSVRVKMIMITAEFEKLFRRTFAYENNDDNWKPKKGSGALSLNN